MRTRADLHENRLFKSAFLLLCCSFLDLVDLKNGFGSKFYTRKWYREVWRTKINPFHDKNAALQHVENATPFTRNAVVNATPSSEMVTVRAVLSRVENRTPQPEMTLKMQPLKQKCNVEM